MEKVKKDKTFEKALIYSVYTDLIIQLEGQCFVFIYFLGQVYCSSKNVSVLSTSSFKPTSVRGLQTALTYQHGPH